MAKKNLGSSRPGRAIKAIAKTTPLLAGVIDEEDKEADRKEHRERHDEIWKGFGVVFEKLDKIPKILEDKLKPIYDKLEKLEGYDLPGEYKKTDSVFVREEQFDTSTSNVDEYISSTDIFNPAHKSHFSEKDRRLYLYYASIQFGRKLVLEGLGDKIDLVVPIQRKGELLFNTFVDKYIPRNIIRRREIKLSTEDVQDRTILLFDDSIWRGNTVSDLIDKLQDKAKKIFVMSLAGRENTLDDLRKKYRKVEFLDPTYKLDTETYSVFYREVMFPYFNSLCLPLDNDHLVLEIEYEGQILKEVLKSILGRYFGVKNEIFEPSWSEHPEEFKLTYQDDDYLQIQNLEIDCSKTRFYIHNDEKKMFITPIINPKFIEPVNCIEVGCLNKDWFCLETEIKKSNEILLDDVIPKTRLDCVTYNLTIDLALRVVKILKKALAQYKPFINKVAWDELEGRYSDYFPIGDKLNEVFIRKDI